MIDDNSCTMQDQCANVDKRCADCLGYYAIDPEGVELPMLYSPLPGSPRRHPLAVEQHAAKVTAARNARQAKKQKPSYQRSKAQTRNSQQNERNTRAVIARATVRSGAAYGDGDTVIEGCTIGIDDKHQSRSSKSITLPVASIDKARSQSCILVITNVEGRKFAVAELDWLLRFATEVGNATT